MKKKDRESLQALSIEELEKKVQDFRREYSLVKLQKQRGKVKNLRSLSTLRKAQAMALTWLTQKKQENA